MGLQQEHVETASNSEEFGLHSLRTGITQSDLLW